MVQANNRSSYENESITATMSNMDVYTAQISVRRRLRQLMDSPHKENVYVMDAVWPVEVCFCTSVVTDTNFHCVIACVKNTMHKEEVDIIDAEDGCFSQFKEAMTHSTNKAECLVRYSWMLAFVFRIVSKILYL